MLHDLKGLPIGPALDSSELTGGAANGLPGRGGVLSHRGSLLNTLLFPSPCAVPLSTYRCLASVSVSPLAGCDPMHLCLSIALAPALVVTICAAAACGAGDVVPPRELEASIAAVSRRPEMVQECGQAYAAWLGFYKTFLRRCGFTKEDLVEACNRYGGAAGRCAAAVVVPTATVCSPPPSVVAGCS
jgi:hypothetical protein